MKKYSLLNLALIPLLLSVVAGCNNNSNNSESDNEIVESSSSEIIVTQQPDKYGVLPTDVINANLEIDFLVYIEGQNGTIKDIGNYSPYYNDEGLPYDPETGELRTYGPNDVYMYEMMRFFGSASAFKKLAPGVKINLIYCSIGEYNSNIRAYRDQYQHLPHLMWATDHVVEMMEVGYAADLTQYSDAAYYESYNDYFMTRFNFGGFQGGFPIAAEPWGVFVNTQDLEEYYVINDVYDEVTGENTDEYKEWVDNFTWEAFIDAVKKTSNDTHAGLSKVVDYFTSYSLNTVNEQFISQGTVDFTSQEILPTMTKLLEYENELATNSQYTVYLYDESSTGSTPNTNKFPNAAGWAGTQNFCEDQYCTFYAEAPWAMSIISQYIDNRDLEDSITVDFLPYPMVDEDANQYTGIAVEGLTVGNQTPIDAITGKPTPKGYKDMEDALLHQKVAAYFAMFMGADPRSIQALSEVRCFYNDFEYVGSLPLPIVKKGFRFDWQDNEELSASDPALAYEDNWQYNLALYLQLYDAYVNDDQPADVEDFTNIAYGLTRMLDTVYGDEVTTLNFWNEPVNIYEDGEVRDVFFNWQTRFTHFQNPETLTGTLGYPDYVDSVLAGLKDLEDDINNNSTKILMDLQDNLDMYYGAGKYNVMDRDTRNDYEGSIIS